MLARAGEGIIGVPGVSFVLKGDTSSSAFRSRSTAYARTALFRNVGLRSSSASSTSTSVHRDNSSVACLTSVGSVHMTHLRNLVKALLSLVR